jgi:hypothetical protein
MLAGPWVAAMLAYLWGDVLRIMAGHVKPREIKGAKATQSILVVHNGFRSYQAQATLSNS